MAPPNTSCYGHRGSSTVQTEGKEKEMCEAPTLRGHTTVGTNPGPLSITQQTKVEDGDH